MQALRSRRRGGGKAAALIALAVVLLGASGALIWLFAGREQPEDVVQRFVDAIVAKDLEAQKGCLTDASAQLVSSTGMSLEQLVTMFQVNPDEAWTVGDAKLEADRATVPVTMKLGGRFAQIGLSQIALPFVLVKAKGAWRIDLEASSAEWGRGLGGGGLDLGSLKGP